jgi:hypothetical protein
MSSTKYYFIFGIAAGLVSVVLEYLLFSGYLGYDKSFGVILGKFCGLLISMIFAIIVIKKMNGRISFLRTTFTGMILALICSSVSAIGFLYMQNSNPAFFEEAKIYHLQEWKDHYADQPDELKKEAEISSQIDQKFTLKFHTIFDLGGFMVFGVLFSTLLAAFFADRTSLSG